MNDEQQDRRARVMNALSEETGKPPAEWTDTAETYLAVVDHFHVGLGDLLFWIHDKKPGKDWTLAGLRSHCDQVARLAMQLGLATGLEPLELCPDCHLPMIRVRGVNFCAGCAKAVE